MSVLVRGWGLRRPIDGEKSHLYQVGRSILQSGPVLI